MEFLLSWLLFASIQLAASMSPGPAFAMQIRAIIKYGRKGGIFTALGLGAGIAVHVILTLGGLVTVMAHAEGLFIAIKYLGAAYLAYIGIKALKAKPQNETIPTAENVKDFETISALKALQIGFWTNVLNPKAVVFFTAVFTQFIAPDAGVPSLLLYGATSIAVESLWFIGLTIVLTVPPVRRTFRRIQHWIERVCGGLLLALGVRLALSKI